MSDSTVPVDYFGNPDMDRSITCEQHTTTVDRDFNRRQCHFVGSHAIWSSESFGKVNHTVVWYYIFAFRRWELVGINHAGAQQKDADCHQRLPVEPGR